MTPEQIAQIRRFNRLYAQRLGVLEEDYLARGRPLAEARLLYEIGTEAVEARALRQRLGLDSGYLSRLLRSLERQRLVRGVGDASDRRRKLLRLTAAGKRERAAYDRLSDGLAASMACGMSPDESTRLVSILTEAERLIRKASIEIAEVSAESTEAQRCLKLYYEELDRRFDGGFDPSVKAYAGTVTPTMPRTYFALARTGGEVAGCGSLIWSDLHAGEIKRMWVAPEARRLGVSRRILDHLESVARREGLAMLRLDTNRALAEAQALYRSAGYSEIPRYSDNPYAHHWFGKTLVDSQQ